MKRISLNSAACIKKVVHDAIVLTSISLVYQLCVVAVKRMEDSVVALLKDKNYNLLIEMLQNLDATKLQRLLDSDLVQKEILASDFIPLVLKAWGICVSAALIG